MHIQFNNVSWVDFSSPSQEIRCIWTGAYLRRDRLKTQIGNNWEFALSKLSIWTPSHLVSFFPPPFPSPCFMFFFLLSVSLPYDSFSLLQIVYDVFHWQTDPWIFLVFSVLFSYNISSRGQVFVQLSPRRDGFVGFQCTWDILKRRI